MNRPIRFPYWFLIILLAAFAVGYLAWAKATFNWPYDGTIFPYPEHRGPSTSSGTKTNYSPSEVEGWKTYRNTEYGFEVRYPPNIWNIIKDKNTIVTVLEEIQINEDYALSKKLKIFSRGSGWIENMWEIYVKKIEREANFQIDSQKALLTGIENEAQAWHKRVEFIYKNEAFVILMECSFLPESGLSLRQEDKDQCSSTFDQILSTFRFIEDELCVQVITPARNLETGVIREFPTPCDVPEGWEKIGGSSPSTSSGSGLEEWKTYQNKEYGFEFSFSTAYIVRESYDGFITVGGQMGGNFFIVGPEGPWARGYEGQEGVTLNSIKEQVVLGGVQAVKTTVFVNGQPVEMFYREFRNIPNSRWQDNAEILLRYTTFTNKEIGEVSDKILASFRFIE